VYRRFRDIVEEVQAEIDRDNLDAAQRLAHTFKGLTGTVGAEELSEISFRLESALENEATGEIPALMGSFAMEVNRVMAALEPIVLERNRQQPGEFHEAVEPNPLNAAQLEGIPEELSSLIDEGDSEAIALVGRLKDLLGSSRLAEKVLRLESQIEDYEFEDARTTLDQILKQLNMEG
jgi:polar amino acid transport system substrate-binding protein